MKHLTIKEASELYKKHPDTIRTWLRKNNIKTEKDRRGRVVIRQADLEAEWGYKAIVRPQEASQASDLVKLLRQTNADQAELIKQLMSQQADLQKQVADLVGQQADLLSQQQKLSGALLSLQSGQEKATEQAKVEPTEQITQPEPPKKKWSFFKK